MKNMTTYLNTQEEFTNVPSTDGKVYLITTDDSNGYDTTITISYEAYGTAVVIAHTTFEGNEVTPAIVENIWSPFKPSKIDRIIQEMVTESKGN